MQITDTKSPNYAVVYFINSITNMNISVLDAHKSIIGDKSANL